MPQENDDARHKQRRWRIIRLLGFIFLVLLAAKALTFGLAVAELNTSVQDLQAAPTNAADFGRRVERVFRAVGRASAETRPFTPLIRLGGSDGCAIADLIHFAGDISALGVDLSPLAEAAFESYSQSSEQRILIAPLRDSWSSLNANQPMRQIQNLTDRPRCLADQPRIRAWQEASDGVLFLLNFFVTTPWQDLLADNETTIIVLNNSDELRATGGFTTAVIVVEIQDGYLNWRLTNSYAVDNEALYDYHPPAPVPQQRYMALSKWTFRDANWSPDHRESAEVALRLYAVDQEVTAPRNLITVNFTALETLMNYVSSIHVNNDTLTAENMMNVVREAWGFDSSLNSNDPARKNFLQELAWDIGAALAEQLSPVEQARLGLAVQDMLDRRDIMIYSAIPVWRDWLASQGWDGALISSTGDYLMVVDSNLGYNKMTLYSEQDIRYEVDLRESPQSRLTLQYRNTVDSDLTCTQYTRGQRQIEAEGREPSYYDRAVNCYWNYVRVLVPQNSRIQDYQVWAAPSEWFPISRAASPAQIDALQIGPYSGFGTMLVVPVQDSRELWFEYNLPPDIVQKSESSQHYHLIIQKQPGAPPARLQIEIQLPDNAAILSAAPANFVVYGSRLMLEQTFDRDLTIDIHYN